MSKEPRLIGELNIGDKVVCDICGNDWTERTEHGGFQFQSKAVCPECAPELELNIDKYNERQFVRGYCPPEKTFADWVRQDLRHGNPGTIRTYMDYDESAEIERNFIDLCEAGNGGGGDDFNGEPY